jgi:hypothetical protein
MITSQPEVVSGSTPEPPRLPAEVCPRCATRRVGSFRFCLSCHHDYDQPMLEAPTAATMSAAISSAALCPSCHTRRIGNFRFCLTCRRDFDQGSPRGLSAASLGMASAWAASQARSGLSMASPTTTHGAVTTLRAASAVSRARAGAAQESLSDRPWSPTSIQAETAAAEVAVDLLSLAPAQGVTESRPVTIQRLTQPVGTRAEGFAAARAEPVTRTRAGRRTPRRRSVVVAAIAIALLGVSGAIAVVFGLGATGGRPSDRPVVGLASPGAIPGSTPIPDPTPIPTYSAAIRPGPITFGTKLSGLTIADPRTRIKIGPRVIWVARMSQPSIESAVEMSIIVLVSGKQIVVHRESTPIGLNGQLTANPGVNTRDLGLGKFVVRYTSQGTVLAEGSFTVVK